MEDIPDHAITNPFSLTTEKSHRAYDRFEKYREFIVEWFRDIHAVYSMKRGGFDCPVCNSYISSWKSSKVLAHLASLKHLKAALGDLEESDQRNSRRVSSQHTIHSTDTPISSVIDSVGSSLGEE
jgi:hypothetical protein